MPYLMVVDVAHAPRNASGLEERLLLDEDADRYVELALQEGACLDKAG
jgi:hypothetical protein